MQDNRAFEIQDGNVLVWTRGRTWKPGEDRSVGAGNRGRVSKVDPFSFITALYLHHQQSHALLTSTFLPFQVSEKTPMISAEDLFIVIELLLSHNVCVPLMETIFSVSTHFFLGGNWNTPLQFTQLQTVYGFWYKISLENAITGLFYFMWVTLTLTGTLLSVGPGALKDLLTLILLFVQTKKHCAAATFNASTGDQLCCSE